MTKEEALQQAAEEIQKKEQHEFATKELAGKINSGTNEIVKNQRDNKVKELQEQQDAYTKIYKKENPVIAQEINDILGLSAKEGTEKNTLDNLMLQIQLSNKEDKYLASFKDEATFNAFNMGLERFGREIFIPEFEKNEYNVFTTLMKLYGLDTFDQLFEKIKLENEQKKQDEKDFYRSVNPDKDSEMIEKIAQRVAEIMKNQK